MTLCRVRQLNSLSPHNPMALLPLWVQGTLGTCGCATSRPSPLSGPRSAWATTSRPLSRGTFGRGRTQGSVAPTTPSPPKIRLPEGTSGQPSAPQRLGHELSAALLWCLRERTHSRVSPPPLPGPTRTVSCSHLSFDALWRCVAVVDVGEKQPDPGPPSRWLEQWPRRVWGAHTLLSTPSSPLVL